MVDKVTTRIKYLVALKHLQRIDVAVWIKDLRGNSLVCFDIIFNHHCDIMSTTTVS